MKPFERLGRRDLRLASGLVLFTYVTVHLINHALGLVSIEVAEAALALVAAFWHSAPGTVLLYGAAATHVGLALLAVYERRTLRMPPLQGLRIVLGLWIPVVLIAHFTGARLAFDLYGLPADDARIVPALWSPEGQGRQLALLAPGWIHGCLGLRFAFAGKTWYRRSLPVLSGAALLLPVLAGLGFVAMGRELAHTSAVPLRDIVIPRADDHGPELTRVREALLALYFGAIALMFAARELRSLIERRRKALFAIAYPARTVQVPLGWNVLEASRAFGIPHLSLCGGRARCSTCRVRIVAGAEHCPPPAAVESDVLERMQAGDDVRLACQLRPGGDVGIVPVLAAAGSRWRGAETPPPTLERSVAIIAADLRRSPAAASMQRSAHDTVYALNLFYETFGDAVTEAGGTPCGFSGQGAIAVFGLRGDSGTACKQALNALASIERAVATLDARLASELGATGMLTLAAHAGPAVIGQLGHRGAKALTAVGPEVELALRLREHAQAQGFGCVISRGLLEAAGAADVTTVWQDVEVRGGGEPVRVCAGASSGRCLAAAMHAGASGP